MTITIPTGELVGVLADVLPFAFPEDDLPHVNCVRVEWDGEMLHAEATDTLHAARSSWHPDDNPDGNTDQPTLHNPLGGADDPWALLVAYDDAREVMKDYKLPTKEAQVPLLLEYDNGALTIRRTRDTGHTAKKITLEGRMVEFPPIGRVLDADFPIQPTGEVKYSGAVVARVGQVRQRGLMRMSFGDRRTRVSIGNRFLAALTPDRSGDPPRQATLDADRAADLVAAEVG